MADLTRPTNPALSVDDATKIWYGLSGGAFTAGDMVTPDGSGGWVAADRSSVATVALMTLTTATAAGEPIKLVLPGAVVAGFASLTQGTAYYLSTNAGRICPLADVTPGDNVILVGYAWSTQEFMTLMAPLLGGENLVALALSAQGALPFEGAAGWEALAPGTDGQVLRSGGAGADVAWGDVLQTVRVEPQSDVGAGATVNYDILKVPTGFKLTPVELQLQCGTVADATFSLQADDIDIDTPAAAADDAAITTFTDTVDAGEVARLEVVTQGGTGDLDAPQFTLFYYLRPV